MLTRSLTRSLGLAVALSMASAPVVAQQSSASGTGLRAPWQSGFWNYAGVSLGTAEYDMCVVGFGCDRRDTAWKIYGGGKLNETIGFEVSWLDLGRAEVAGGYAEAQGLNLSILAGYPIGANSGVHAKLGTTFGQTEVTTAVAGGAAGRERDWGLSYGLGASIGITPRLQARLDWDRYRFAFAGRDDDVDTIMLGLQYKF